MWKNGCYEIDQKHRIRWKCVEIYNSSFSFTLDTPSMVRFKKQFDNYTKCTSLSTFSRPFKFTNPNETRYLVESIQLYKVHRKHVHFFVNKDFRRLVFFSTQYILCCLINFHLFWHLSQSWQWLIEIHLFWGKYTFK